MACQITFLIVRRLLDLSRLGAGPAMAVPACRPVIRAGSMRAAAVVIGVATCGVAFVVRWVL
jgi:hypothetical protein